jgi:hypothetical protein
MVQKLHLSACLVVLVFFYKLNFIAMIIIFLPNKHAHMLAEDGHLESQHLQAAKMPNFQYSSFK